MDCLTRLSLLLPSALPLASLGSFCTHPLPRVPNRPITLLHTPPLNAIHGPQKYIMPRQALGYWWTKRPACFWGTCGVHTTLLFSLHESHGLHLFKVMWVIVRELCCVSVPKQHKPPTNQKYIMHWTLFQPFGQYDGLMFVQPFGCAPSDKSSHS